MNRRRLVNGGPLAGILAAVLLVCGHVPGGPTPLAVAQQSSGEQRSSGEQPSSGKEQSPGEARPSDKPQSKGSSGLLFGHVTRGPLPPAGDSGGVRPPGSTPGRSPAPVALARVGVTPVGSSHVWWVVTGVYGDFAIALPPGTYRVTIEVPPDAGVPKDVPPTVTITAGERTRLDVHLDSGMR